MVFQVYNDKVPGTCPKNTKLMILMLSGLNSYEIYFTAAGACTAAGNVVSLPLKILSISNERTRK